MTERMQDTVVDLQGRPIAAASITVRDADGALVTLLTPAAASQANPITSDAVGGYDVLVPAAGLYYLTITKGTASVVVEKEVAMGGERWTEIGTSKWTPAPSDTQTLLASDTSDLQVGIPLRYTIGGVAYYGCCASITTDTSFTVVGAPLGGTLTKLEVGRPEMRCQISLNCGGAYAATAQTIMDNITLTYIEWQLTAAYLVGIKVRHTDDDTGANQPHVNATIGGTAVSTGLTGDGLAVATTWASNGVAIDTDEYAVALGDGIEIEVTDTGSNADAENLSATLIFVVV